MLYFIGLGLSDEKDVTVRGLEVIKRAERVYLEAYTAVLLVEKEQLESFYGRHVIVADREMVESSSDDILKDADKVDVAFLVVGDPFGATTHTDLQLRARNLSIPTMAIPNASIMNAIGVTGLSLYNFGQTISMVFFTENWRPASFYDRIVENASIGLHSLLLLDIKVKEPDFDHLVKTGKTKYLPPRFMTIAQCAQQMVEIEEDRKEGVCAKNKLAVGAARVGSDKMKVVVGTLEELCEVDMGPPLHSLVLVGKKIHEVERDVLRLMAINESIFDQAWRDGAYGT